VQLGMKAYFNTSIYNITREVMRNLIKSCSQKFQNNILHQKKKTRSVWILWRDLLSSVKKKKNSLTVLYFIKWGLQISSIFIFYWHQLFYVCMCFTYNIFFVLRWSINKCFKHFIFYIIFNNDLNYFLNTTDKKCQCFLSVIFWFCTLGNIKWLAHALKYDYIQCGG